MISSSATEVDGGPNYVPAPCTSIYLQLTDVTQRTYAQACLETPDGQPVNCGEWVFLADGGRWNTLYDGVEPGQRWLLKMRADAGEDVKFQFSG